MRPSAAVFLCTGPWIAQTAKQYYLGVICPLQSGPISNLEMTNKEEWNGEEAQARTRYRQAACS
jgi:hypothetical protein